MDQSKYREFFDRCVRELQSNKERLVAETNKYEIVIQNINPAKPYFRVSFRHLGTKAPFEVLFDFSSHSKLMLEFGAEQAFIYAQDLVTNEIIHFDKYDSFLRSFTLQK